MSKSRRLLQGLVAIVVSACATHPSIGGNELFERVTTRGKHIFISTHVVNNLSYLYSGIVREMPLCLLGYENDIGFFIRDLKMPFYTSGNENMSSFDKSVCDGDEYLGLVHNHMSGNCGMSVIDYNRFRADTAARLELVVCGVEQGGGITTYFMIKGGEP